MLEKSTKNNENTEITEFDEFEFKTDIFINQNLQQKQQQNHLTSLAIQRKLDLIYNIPFSEISHLLDLIPINQINNKHFVFENYLKSIKQIIHEKDEQITSKNNHLTSCIEEFTEIYSNIEKSKNIPRHSSFLLLR